MGHVVIVGDTGGFVQAYRKETGEPVRMGGYPLKLSDEPYRSGQQGERWWEPIGGTATQMTVASELMLVGVNSQTDERTVLKAFKLYPLPDLTLTFLDVPASTDFRGFPAKVRAVCRGCAGDPIRTTVSLKINGTELPRRPVTFRAEDGWKADVAWDSGPLPAGATVEVVATVDPNNLVEEADETNNTLRAAVDVPRGEQGFQDEPGFGSRLSN